MQQTNVRIDFHLALFEIEIHPGYKYSTKCFDMNYIGAAVLSKNRIAFQLHTAFGSLRLLYISEFLFLFSS